MNAVVQNFYLPPGTLIAYDGYQVIVAAQVHEGLAVRDRYIGDDEKPQYFVISKQTLNHLLLRQDVEIDTDFSVDAPTAAVSARAQNDAFRDADPEDRRIALMKEAWCLATRSVLGGGPYDVSIIKKNFEAIKADALDRHRLGGIGENGDGYFVSKVWGRNP